MDRYCSSAGSDWDADRLQTGDRESATILHRKGAGRRHSKCSSSRGQHHGGYYRSGRATPGLNAARRLLSAFSQLFSLLYKTTPFLTRCRHHNKHVRVSMGSEARKMNQQFELVRKGSSNESTAGTTYYYCTYHGRRLGSGLRAGP